MAIETYLIGKLADLKVWNVWKFECLKGLKVCKLEAGTCLIGNVQSVKVFKVWTFENLKSLNVCKAENWNLKKQNKRKSGQFERFETVETFESQTVWTFESLKRLIVSKL